MTIMFYNEIADFLNKEHEGVRIHQITPPDYLDTSSYFTSSINSIETIDRIGSWYTIR